MRIVKGIVALLIVLSFTTVALNYQDGLTPTSATLSTMLESPQFLLESEALEAVPEHIDFSRTVVIGLPTVSPQAGNYVPDLSSVHNYLRAFWLNWGNSFNYAVSFKLLDVNQAYQALDQGEVDVLSAAYYLKGRQGRNLYSIPYLEVNSVLYRRSGELPERPVLGVHRLSEQALPSSIEKHYRVQKIADPSYALKEQQFDLLFSNAPFMFRQALHEQDLLSQFRPIEASGYRSLLRAVVVGERRELMLDINTGIRTHPSHLVDSQWQQASNGNEVPVRPIRGGYLPQLSLAKQHFIVDHPVLEYAAGELGYQPYSINQRGLMSGFAVDVLREIGKQTGLVFVPQEVTTFQQSLKLVKDGAIDILPNASLTKERQQYFSFSVPFEHASTSIISESGYDQLEQLSLLSLALVRGYHETQLLEARYPQAKLHYFDSPQQALKAVAQHRVDAYVGNELNSRYIIQTLNLSNLELRSVETLGPAMQLRFASSNLRPQLNGLLNMGINAIGDQRLQEIRQSWVERYQNQEVEQELSLIYQRLTIAGIGLMLLVALFFALYRYQMHNRRRAHSAVQAALAAAEIARADAELSAKAKTEFLARMSHEIRTPMNGVLGMTEALSYTELSCEQKDLLDTLNGSARNLMALLNDVLDFSKMDADKLTLEQVPLSLPSLIKGVLDNYRHRAKAEGQQLKTQIDPQISENYLGDPTRLAQVLNNLVSNALKFTSSGFVEVNVALINRADKGQQDHLLFSVRDTGIGIEEGKQQGLFDPFVQAEGDTTRKFGGSGLGLSICKEILATMGSSIKVDSIVGMGSLFSFSLALPRQHRADINQRFDNFDLQPHFDLSELRVLFAEDNAVNRKVILGQLQRLGVNADVAENGREALAMHRKQNYQVVLSDCHMPEMDGFTLAKILSEEREQKLPYIIAITADALSGAAEQCLTAGFDDYISKPCPADILENKLNQAAESLGLQPVQDTFASGQDLYLIHPDNQDHLEEITCHQLAQEIVTSLAQEPTVPSANHLAQAFHFNDEHLLDMCGDDMELAQEIIQVFLERAEPDRQELQLALSQGAGETLKNVAHRIKGSFRYLGAELLAEQAQQLEELAMQALQDQTTRLAESLLFGITQVEVEAKLWLQLNLEEQVQ